MTDIAPVPLDQSHSEAAAEVLVRAFAADPGLLFGLPDLADRERLGLSLAQAVVRFSIRCGSPLVMPDPVRGIALWFPPDAPAPTADDIEQTGIRQVPEQLGSAAWARFKRMLDLLDALHPLYAPEPHWYLAMIGVDPIYQGQGVGESLMRPILSRADHDGVACYLETPNQGNVRFYEQRGFRVMAETDIPESDVHLWLMHRDPATVEPA